MDEAGPSSPWRAPTGVAAGIAAALAAIAVVSFGRLEGLAAEVLGIDGGPVALIFAAIVFVVLWALGAGVLAAWAPRPAREGLWAGALVGALVLVILASIAAARGDVVIVALLAPIFVGLALGLGALAGNVAQAWRDRRPSRTASVLALSTGLLFFLTSALFFLPGGPGFGSPVGLAVLAFTLLLVGGGLWGLVAAQKAPAG